MFQPKCFSCDANITNDHAIHEIQNAITDQPDALTDGQIDYWCPSCIVRENMMLPTETVCPCVAALQA